MLAFGFSNGTVRTGRVVGGCRYSCGGPGGNGGDAQGLTWPVVCSIASDKANDLALPARSAA